VSDLWKELDKKASKANQKHKKELAKQAEALHKKELKNPSRNTMIRFPEVTEYDILIVPEEAPTKKYDILIIPKEVPTKKRFVGTFLVFSSSILLFCINGLASFEESVTHPQSPIYNIEEVKEVPMTEELDEDAIINKIEEIQRQLDDINKRLE
jgi:hypothetical protein